MTEQRYSDGTLAKWYYCRNNSICDGINEYSLLSKEKFEDINFEKILGTNDLLDELNRLSDENEQLKSEFKDTGKKLNKVMRLLVTKEYAQMFIQLQDVLCDLVEKELID